MNIWNKYIGIPFKDNARGPDFFDCYGLLYAIYKNERNIQLPLFTTRYFSTFNHKNIKELIEEQTAKNWKKVETPKPYDIVIFKFRGWPIHVGLVMDEQCFIHALRGCDVCVEEYTSPLWKNRCEGFYEYSPNYS